MLGSECFCFSPCRWIERAVCY